MQHAKLGEVVDEVTLNGITFTLEHIPEETVGKKIYSEYCGVTVCVDGVGNSWSVRDEGVRTMRVMFGALTKIAHHQEQKRGDRKKCSTQN